MSAEKQGPSSAASTKRSGTKTPGLNLWTKNNLPQPRFFMIQTRVRFGDRSLKRTSAWSHAS